MTKFEAVEEKVVFVSWGKPKPGQKKESSYVVKEGETIEGLVRQIKDSSKGYGKIYTLEVKDSEDPVIITGKTDLNNKLGYGNMSVKPIAKGDIVRITYTGQYSTQGGKKGFKFDVEVARA